MTTVPTPIITAANFNNYYIHDDWVKYNKSLMSDLVSSVRGTNSLGYVIKGAAAYEPEETREFDEVYLPRIGCRAIVVSIDDGNYVWASYVAVTPQGVYIFNPTDVATWTRAGVELPYNAQDYFNSYKITSETTRQDISEVFHHEIDMDDVFDLRVPHIDPSKEFSDVTIDIADE